MKARRYLDGTREFEITEQDRALLSAATRADIIAVLKECVAIDENRISDNRALPVVNPSTITKSNKLPEKDWMFITEALGERRGSHDHAHYIVYQHKRTKSVAGLIKSKYQNRVYYLGNPKDNKSIIAQIRRKVESLPFREPFTRSELVEILPANLARSETIKFALQYLKHFGIIAEEKGKQLGTGAKRYVRQRESGDSTSQELGYELAGAIPR